MDHPEKGLGIEFTSELGSEGDWSRRNQGSMCGKREFLERKLELGVISKGEIET